MRKLDSNEHKICRFIGKIFELSVDLSKFSSDMFIRRFMFSDYSKTYFDKTYLLTSNKIEDSIILLNKKYANYGKKVVYTKNQMFWIGNIYGSISFLYDLPHKKIYKMLPGNKIVEYYNIYHTFSLEQASTRIMENILYKKKNYIFEGVEILKRLEKDNK